MFGHFTKLLCYFIWGKTNKQKRKNREEIKEKRKPPPAHLPGPAWPEAGPAHQGQGRLPPEARQAARRRGEHARRPRPPPASPWPPPPPRGSLEGPRAFPPPL